VAAHQQRIFVLLAQQRLLAGLLGHKFLVKHSAEGSLRR
jgi:hypothetical protein